jgi:hypothetical protein
LSAVREVQWTIRRRTSKRVSSFPGGLPADRTSPRPLPDPAPASQASGAEQSKRISRAQGQGPFAGPRRRTDDRRRQDQGDPAQDERVQGGRGIAAGMAGWHLRAEAVARSLRQEIERNSAGVTAGFFVSYEGKLGAALCPSPQPTAAHGLTMVGRNRASTGTRSPKMQRSPPFQRASSIWPTIQTHGPTIHGLTMVGISAGFWTNYGRRWE